MGFRANRGLSELTLLWDGSPQSEWLCRNECRKKEGETTASLLTILAVRGQVLAREHVIARKGRHRPKQPLPDRPRSTGLCPIRPTIKAFAQSPLVTTPTSAFEKSIVPEALGVINTNTAPTCTVPRLGSLSLRLHPWPLLFPLPPCLRSYCHRGSSRRVDTTSSYLISTPC